MIVPTGNNIYSVPASIERGAHPHPLSEPSGRTPPVRLFREPAALNNNPHTMGNIQNLHKRKDDNYSEKVQSRQREKGHV
jgi:hypothetical protein